MTAPSVSSTNSRSTIQQLALVVGAGVVILVLYEALHFWLTAALHYIIDQTPESYRRYWPRRISLLLHIAGGTLALFSGPFQFFSGFRRRMLRLHRALGYTYIGGIALAGGAGFYLSFFTKPADFGVALFTLASVWWITVGMAFVAIRNRQFVAHREWMMRSYLVTLVFVSFRYIIDFPIWERFGASAAATVLWITLALPLAVAEVVLQWRHVAPRQSRPARG